MWKINRSRHRYDKTFGTKISGKGSGRGRHQGRGGQGSQVGRGRSRSARGYSYSGVTPKHKVLCSSLGNHVFDYVQKAPADQVRNTWEKLVHHVGKIHGHDISKKLLNNKTVIIPNLDHN